MKHLNIKKKFCPNRGQSIESSHSIYIYILVSLRFHKCDMCFHAVPEWVIVAEWRHMARFIWVGIGSGTGLLLDGTKPLSEPLFTYMQKNPVTVIRQIPPPSISKMNTKIYLITSSDQWVNLGSIVSSHASQDNELINLLTACWVLGRWEPQCRQLRTGQFHWMLMSQRNLSCRCR